jgi:imidazolonepropionase-like amidohydrolase
MLMLDYLTSFVDAGVPPKDILRAMTTDAALLLGVEKQRGSIQPRLAADLIAVPTNPLDDIYALRQVVFVMKDGNVVFRR